MKSILFIFCLMATVQLSAQCINGTKSYPIYKKGAELVSEFDEKGAEIVRIEYDLIFSTKSSFRDLSKSWEYVIVGFADDGVKNLDLKLYEWDDLLEKWTLVKEDNSEETYGFITVKPSVNASYKVEVIVAEFHEGYTAARYGLLYLHE